MKVLIIPTWLPSEIDNLLGIYHKEFCEALNKNGVKADILFIDRQRLSKPLKFIFMKKNIAIEEQNYKIFKKRILNFSPINFDLQMTHYTIALLKAVKKYINENGRPDIIHAHITAPAGYASCVVGKKLNIPVVVTEHTAKLERFFNQEPFKKYGLFVIRNCYYTTVSKYMQDITLKYTNQCDILPNQVNVNLFKNNIKRKIEDEFKIISVCALREGKGIDVALKAIKLLVDEGFNIHYTIIGDGFKEEYYKNIASYLKLDKYVTFLGRKTKEEISAYLEKNHALLISSNIESFGIPGIEALASGMPVITTDCLGPPSFIDKKCGEICKVNDAFDMAEKIKKVYSKYSDYDKKYLESVAAQFSEKNIADKAISIYEELLK